MERINISFSEEVYDKLEARRQSMGQKSLAEGVRELVNLGLKIEESAKNNNDTEDENDIKLLREMLKNNLIWSMETRLLTRFLVEHSSPSDQEKMVEILDKYKEKATDHVKGLFREDIL